MNKQEILDIMQIIIIAVGIMLLTIGTLELMDNNPLGMGGVLIGVGIIFFNLIYITLSGSEMDE